MNGRQQGSLLIAAVAILVTLSLLAAVTGRLFVAQVRGNTDLLFAEQALQLAESGMEKAKYELSLSPAYTGEVNTAFANGAFTTTVLTTDFSGTALPSDQRRIRSTGDQTGAGGATISRTVEAIVTLPAASTSGFAAGQNGTVLQWDGSQWIDAGTPRRFNVDVEDAYCSSATSCWFVGLGGAIVYWDGTTFTSSSNTTQDLYAVSCNPVNPAQCFAVGQNGTLETWNGSSWTLSTISTRNLNGLHCLNGECYAVGDNGTILHFDSSSWIDESVGGGTNLNAIHCLATDDCWAVGDRNSNNFTLLQRDSVGWSDRSQFDASNNENLNGIACLPLSSDCWAVGDNGTLLKYTGTIPWTLSSSPSTGNLLDVWCSSSANECWAVGASSGGRRRGRGRGRSNAPLHWLGGAWTTSSTSRRNRSQLTTIEFIPTSGGSGSLTTSAWQEVIP